MIWRVVDVIQLALIKKASNRLAQSEIIEVLKNYLEKEYKELGERKKENKKQMAEEMELKDLERNRVKVGELDSEMGRIGSREIK